MKWNKHTGVRVVSIGEIVRLAQEDIPTRNSEKYQAFGGGMELAQNIIAW
jgi:hypothetical protein